MPANQPGLMAVTNERINASTNILFDLSNNLIQINVEKKTFLILSFCTRTIREISARNLIAIDVSESQWILNH